MILDVQNLRTWFETSQGPAKAVDGVSFTLEKGRTLAIVGESGCGKTVLATSIMRLFRRPGVSHPTGSIFYNGIDLLKASQGEMQAVRGAKIAMIFQEPMAALNPIMTIGNQISEPLIKHLKATPASAMKRSLELLEALGVPSPDRVLKTWPHTLSGGMRQRVAIAMALACNPDILIADEPTTSLDVTVQAQILQIISDLQSSRGMATILITHDFGVVNEVADDLVVMYSGQIIESGTSNDVIFTPQHPYTRKLIAAVPSVATVTARLDSVPGQVKSATQFVKGCRFAERCDQADARCLSDIPPSLYLTNHRKVSCYLYDPLHPLQPKISIPTSVGPKVLSTTKHSSRKVDGAPVLETKELKTWFPVTGGLFRTTMGFVKALDQVSVAVSPGQTLAVVGESGCGKSTLGQSILRLVEPTSGKVLLQSSFGAFDVITTNKQNLFKIRRDMQIVFQDPFASLNPRFSVREILDEGLRIHEPDLNDEQRLLLIDNVLNEVGLPKDALYKYPHEFSGGQRQRIAIARAIVLKPKILILDEATSALDVSIQAQVLNLLIDLQTKYQMAYLFITHNLGVVRYIADQVAVMYLGKIIEYGSADRVLKNPKHPYTQKLIASVPSLTPGAKLPAPLQGDVPSAVNPPPGCSFHKRCPLKKSKESKLENVTSCTAQLPDLIKLDDSGHVARCHFLDVT